ncbi:MAG TPA: SDR family oxidoreductase [Paraburkholderia sp.]|jgi:NAD(P)-dependent dehydrogenase (short-subunit alcohol dehydrogenase family)
MSNETKTIVITGASSGIGFALAEAYLQRGDHVVGNARTQARLDAAAAKFSNAANFVGVPGDISLPETAQAIFSEAVERFGKVDVLINNAGIFVAKPTADYTAKDVDDMINTNLKGFFYITQQAVRHMVANRSGHIVSITASIAMQPTTALPALLPILIKGGLNQATRGLALELAAHNVKVNAVAPGTIETPLHAGGNEAFLKALQPTGTVGQVSDIVGAVQYLTDSSFTTGVILPVDGGQTAGRW